MGNFNGDKGDDVISTMTRMVSEEAATEDLAREAECTGEAYANATATCRAMCGDAQEDACHLERNEAGRPGLLQGGDAARQEPRPKSGRHAERVRAKMCVHRLHRLRRQWM